MSTLRLQVERHYANASSGNFADESEVFADDVRTIVPGSEPMDSLAAVEAYGRGFRQAFPDMHINLQSTVEDETNVVAEGTLTGTQTGPLVTAQGEIPATHKAIALRFCDVFSFTDGMVTEHRVYFDIMAVMHQLGVA